MSQEPFSTAEKLPVEVDETSNRGYTDCSRSEDVEKVVANAPTTKELPNSQNILLRANSFQS